MPRATPDLPSRLHGLDALRGLAVLLMLEQHLGSWLWRGPAPGEAIADHAAFLGFNAVGGLAFPLFIGLSGASNAQLAAHPRPALDATLARRGVGLWMLGIALNLVTPSWFSWGSFFALHMIGVATLLTPALRRLSRAGLLAVMAAVLAATPLAQHWLGTPMPLDNARMRDVTLAGGALRLAMVEGQYPVFPWLAVYVGGFVAGRDLRAARVRSLGQLALAMVAAGGVACGFEVSEAVHPVLARAFRLPVPFFPASVTIVMLLLGATLLAVTLAARREIRRPVAPTNVLVALGRASLTVFVLHVWLFREAGPRLGLWRTLSPATTLAAIGLVGALTMGLARRWQRVEYRYGAEWLVRKLAG